MNEITSVIVQARMGSTRLPGKIFKEAAGISLLEFCLRRLSKIEGIQHLIVATSASPQDDRVETFCKDKSFEVFRGSENDVLSRYYEAAKNSGATIVVRATSDCPFLDPALISEMIRKFKEDDCDYLSNNLRFSFPHGLDAEVMRFTALEVAHREATKPEDREHVSPFIRNQPERFKLSNFSNPLDPEFQTEMYKMRWTVDHPQDYEFAKQVIEKFGILRPNFTWVELLKFIRQHPEIQALNHSLEDRK
ncbi:MAG: hypothetical protein COV44_09575 [Deltaproteobacteria bacterium CG11_big_fil_rev_8_21_14_0_20_45_16]|nr:MAG: hypothetical protein COV44_09575 [Deltaproteobacteria bacterium CG11_big_fil_rev_8_21_14_0_20_45_16]